MKKTRRKLRRKTKNFRKTKHNKKTTKKRIKKKKTRRKPKGGAFGSAGKCISGVSGISGKCGSVNPGQEAFGYNPEAELAAADRAAADRAAAERAAAKRIQAGIKGMLNSLDPYSKFLMGDGKKKLERLTKGKYGGVGMHISKIEHI